MNLKIRDITITAIFTALTAILAQISLPLPFSPVPITFQVMAVYISAIILGSRLGALSQIIYVLLGAVGIPIFVNFQGGLNVVLGPSGGYLISYPIIAFIIGKISDKNLSFISSIALLAASLLLCYGMGVVQLSLITNISIKKAVVLGALPFIPLDIIKIILAYLLGGKIRSALVKTHLIKC
ncbi:biotin transporter BioY [Clostridium sp. WILCCON 0269]|uniref:Biotin transporter n=1 Tax=Candidatus Clostridium eludens TaxID=3381663 RepID=A0ABW8SPQ5_9CLOT